MNFEFWQRIITYLYPAEERFILEQLLCEGSLPLSCMRCGHTLEQHQYVGWHEGATDAGWGPFCNQGECFGREGRSMCPAFVGPWVERR